MNSELEASIERVTQAFGERRALYFETKLRRHSEALRMGQTYPESEDLALRDEFESSIEYKEYLELHRTCSSDDAGRLISLFNDACCRHVLNNRRAMDALNQHTALRRQKLV